MIHQYSINGIPVATGDIICTHDGGAPVLEGEFWRFVGNLIPGDVDHVAVYLGPEGRCIEAGPRGVITFTVPDKTWDALALREQRGPVVDTFYGVAYPLARTRLSESGKAAVREDVARYCLAQAGKHYNLNFFNSKTEKSFYCSQLAYLAYLRHRINLNTNAGVPHIPGTDKIVYPQEIWSGCANRKA